MDLALYGMLCALVSPQLWQTTSALLCILFDAMANPFARLKARLLNKIKPASPAATARARAQRRKLLLDKGARALPYFQYAHNARLR